MYRRVNGSALSEMSTGQRIEKHASLPNTAGTVRHTPFLIRIYVILQGWNCLYLAMKDLSERADTQYQPMLMYEA